jgi:hypothetical protein
MVMMPRPAVIVIMVPAMTAVPVGPAMGTIMMRPRVSRIGSNLYGMMGSVMACAMEAGPVLAMPSFAFAVRPGAGGKTERYNDCQ